MGADLIIRGRRKTCEWHSRAAQRIVAALEGQKVPDWLRAIVHRDGQCDLQAGETSMKFQSPVLKRSIRIGGHKTSVSLEEPLWNALKEIARGRDMTLSALVAAIESERRHRKLSAAIRLFVLDSHRDQVFEHEKLERTREVLASTNCSTQDISAADSLRGPI